MTITAKAVYENGVLRLQTPLAVNEGTEVEVIVLNAPSTTAQQAQEILANIAAIPSENSETESVSKNHDSYLYGYPS